jgi:hypothetical protein
VVDLTDELEVLLAALVEVVLTEDLEVLDVLAAELVVGETRVGLTDP